MSLCIIYELWNDLLCELSGKANGDCYYIDSIVFQEEFRENMLDIYFLELFLVFTIGWLE